MQLNRILKIGYLINAGISLLTVLSLRSEQKLKQNCSCEQFTHTHSKVPLGEMQVMETLRDTNHIIKLSEIAVKGTIHQCQASTIMVSEEHCESLTAILTYVIIEKLYFLKNVLLWLVLAFIRLPITYNLSLKVLARHFRQLTICFCLLFQLCISVIVISHLIPGKTHTGHHQLHILICKHRDLVLAISKHVLLCDTHLPLKISFSWNIFPFQMHGFGNLTVSLKLQNISVPIKSFYSPLKSTCPLLLPCCHLVSVFSIYLRISKSLCTHAHL